MKYYDLYLKIIIVIQKHYLIEIESQKKNYSYNQYFGFTQGIKYFGY